MKSINNDVVGTTPNTSDLVTQQICNMGLWFLNATEEPLSHCVLNLIFHFPQRQILYHNKSFIKVQPKVTLFKQMPDSGSYYSVTYKEKEP